MKHFDFRPYWLLVLLGLLAGPGVWAQDLAWQEAFTPGQTTGPAPTLTGVAADTLGNVYVMGELIGTVRFGATTLTAGGEKVTFVAKWDDAGHAYRWAVLVAAHLTHLAAGRGGVYVAGNTRLAPTQGLAPLTTAHPGGEFIAKLADAGATARFAWVQPIEAVGESVLRAKALVAQGNSVYLMGVFGGTLRLGSVSVYATRDEHLLSHLFVAKLTEAVEQGAFVWARQTLEEDGLIQQPQLAVAGSEIYLAGTAGSPVKLGERQEPDNRVRYAGRMELAKAYLVRLHDAGATATFAGAELLPPETLVVAETSPNPAGADVQPTALVASGPNVYLAGILNFDWRTYSSAEPMHSLFLVKLPAVAGPLRLLWSQPIRQPGEAACKSLAVRGNEVYLMGTFQGILPLGPTLLEAIGPDNLFLARFRKKGSSGRFDWAERLGGEGSIPPDGNNAQGHLTNSRGRGSNGLLALTSTGTLYLAASLTPSARLGTRLVVPGAQLPYADYLLRFRLPK